MYRDTLVPIPAVAMAESTSLLRWRMSIPSNLPGFQIGVWNDIARDVSDRYGISSVGPKPHHLIRLILSVPPSADGCIEGWNHVPMLKSITDAQPPPDS